MCVCVEYVLFGVGAIMRLPHSVRYCSTCSDTYRTIQPKIRQKSHYSHFLINLFVRWTQLKYRFVCGMASNCDGEALLLLVCVCFLIVQFWGISHEICLHWKRMDVETECAHFCFSLNASVPWICLTQNSLLIINSVRNFCNIERIILSLFFFALAIRVYPSSVVCSVCKQWT